MQSTILTFALFYSALAARGDEVPNMACGILAGTNKVRAGLAPLRGCKNLDQAALNTCKLMAAEGQLTHSPKGTEFNNRQKDAGYAAGGCAENILYNYSPPSKQVNDAVNQWDNSPGHHANMVGPYKDHGAACCQGDGAQIYCVQEFGSGGECGSTYDDSCGSGYSPSLQGSQGDQQIQKSKDDHQTQQQTQKVETHVEERPPTQEAQTQADRVQDEQTEEIPTQADHEQPPITETPQAETPQASTKKKICKPKGYSTDLKRRSKKDRRK